MDYKVTKIEKYGTFSSEKIGTQFYFMVYCHVYADSTKKSYYKVHFLCYFDAEDLCEYYDSDSVSKEQINEYKKEFCYNMADSVCGSNKTIDDVIKDANYYIERYA